MCLDIPENVEGSFYRGQVYVGVKDIVMGQSSPPRHATELYQIMESDDLDKPILLLYADGGLDHCCTYLSVQRTLLSVFLASNYDMLLLVRTIPKGSWRNRPERIMSILNLALQCVGTGRGEMSPEFEAQIRSCVGLSTLRDAAEKSDDLKQAMKDAIEPVKVLLHRLFERLSLKGTSFKTFAAASETPMTDLWNFTGFQGDPPIAMANHIKKALHNAMNVRCVYVHIINT